MEVEEKVLEIREGKVVWLGGKGIEVYISLQSVSVMKVEVPWRLATEQLFWGKGGEGWGFRKKKKKRKRWRKKKTLPFSSTVNISALLWSSFGYINHPSWT